MKRLFYKEYRQLPIYFLIVVVVISCKKVYYAPHEITAPETVPHYDLLLSDLSIDCLGANSILAVDSMLVIFSSDKKSMIQVYNFNGDSLAKLSPSGRASNEFIKVQYAWRNTVINGERYLYLLDSSNGQYYLYNLTGSLKKGANIKPEKKLKRERHVSDVLFRDDGSYFQYKGVSYDDPRDMIFYPPEYSLIDANNKTRKFEIYPNLVSFSSSEDFATQFYFSVVRLSDDGNKAIEVALYQDRMTFIDLESGDMFGLRCNDFIDPKELADATIEEIANLCVRGVRQVVPFNDLLFILYDHRTLYEEEVLGKQPTTSIRVFTWSGEYIAELNPSISISDITIDKRSGNLLAMDENEKFYITNLSNILNDLYTDK